jgi:hypothetical protein
MIWGAYGVGNPSDGGIRWHDVSEPCQPDSQRNRRSRPRKAWTKGAPPAGFEPALTAPEADALSPELWGLRDIKGYQPQPPRGHHALVGAITAGEQLPSRE